MKAFVFVCFVLLALIVWWPAGIALVLVALWHRGTRKDRQGETQSQLLATAEAVRADFAVTSELLKENIALKHEINLREIERIGAALRDDVNILFKSHGLDPNHPEYHAWQILVDVFHDIAMEAIDAQPTERAGLLCLLVDIEGAREGIVRLACTDKRWQKYRDRELGFQDFREMRGLAHVVIHGIIRSAAKSPEGIATTATHA